MFATNYRGHTRSNVQSLSCGFILEIVLSSFIDRDLNVQCNALKPCSPQIDIRLGYASKR